MKSIIKIVLFLILYSFDTFLLKSNENNETFTYGLKAGILWGGPIPTFTPEGFSGSPKFGPHLDLFFDYKISNKVSFHPEISLAIKGLTFSSHIKRDTLVEVNLGGTTGKIPTFYVADANGEMSLTYLDIPMFFTYKVEGITTIYIGFQTSFLIGGKNEGSVHVVVGEGGFYDDVIKSFDSYNSLNKIDFSFCLGGVHDISKKFAFGFYATRSIVSFYKDGTLDKRDFGDAKMFNTFLVLSLFYKF